ncbi:MAG: aminotransferase class I/II-fold pyridoxal phosphate-dependent enzyme [Leptospirales bacterium]
MADNNEKHGFSTRAVHSGEFDHENTHSLTTPIFQTSTYKFKNTAEVNSFFAGDTTRVAEYGRYGNPTQMAAEEKLRSLENAEAALLFSSGMAAVTTAILALCKQGDHVVITSDSYRRTRQFILGFMPKFGLEFSVVEPDAATIENSVKDNTKLIISEAPTNPYLRVLDLAALVSVAKKHKVKTLIDSTLATPINLRPLEYGVDLVTHSATKYFGGHNDLLAGVLMGKESLINAIQDLQGMLGPITDPNTSYLIIRGLKTLSLRVERQNKTALAVARFLETHPKVEKTWYPGIESHPDYEVAKKQMTGFGGVVSFQVKGDLEVASKMIDNMKIPLIAPSLGGVESLIEQPSLMSYYELSSAEREAIGIFDNLIRFSIGVEDEEDIIQDLRQALDSI